MNDSKNTDLALAAKEILQTGGDSTLATHSIKHEGFPYASVTPYALDESSRPVFLFSSMATHTRNLKQNPNASLLVSQVKDDDLSKGRATVIGTVARIPNGALEFASKAYLDKHPSAEQWVSFGDFAFYRMEILEIYIVAGFGAMGWVRREELR